MNGKRVIKILEAHGWILDRVTGSHHVMMKGARAVPIPVHGAKDLKIGLIKGIERQTGVKLI